MFNCILKRLIISLQNIASPMSKYQHGLGFFKTNNLNLTHTQECYGVILVDVEILQMDRGISGALERAITLDRDWGC